MVKQSPRFLTELTRATLALILAGGRGSRLKHLTHWRAKPAVPFGGIFRVIDFSLSNCLNSGIRRMGVLTQYKADSLIRHIQHGWNFLEPDLGEFVQLLPAQQRIESDWYLGTADAIYQNLDIIRMHNPEYVIILGGDHIYKMDYGLLIANHVENRADITISTIELPVENAKRFSVVDTDKDGRIRRFIAKPEQPITIPGQDDLALTSMGIYVFKIDVLYEQLIKDADSPESTHDFTFDVIPSAIESGFRVVSFPFKDSSTGQTYYWQDVGTVDAYWQANIELLGVTPPLNIQDTSWPVWTYRQILPPAKMVFDDEDRRGMAVGSMVSGGCIVSGSTVRNSLLFTNVRIDSYSTVEDTVVLPNVDIGRNCQIRKAVIDSGCHIPEGTLIGTDQYWDAKNYYVTERGVVLVVPEMLGQHVSVR